MNKNRERQGFDAVAFKRKAQAEISEEIKGPNPEEEITYFRQAAEAGPLGEWWRSVKQIPTSRRQ